MATTTMSESVNLRKSAIAGIAGGVVGGIVFGIMMGIQNMLPMVGMLVGQDNVIVGFIVHMLISTFIGATYGFIAPRLPQSTVAQVIGGGVYGIVWWVLGALILMPLMLGMSAMVLQIGEMQISSLIGHILFGVVMGIVTKQLLK
jgi:uncharacterized membrane protein YagU involved in acid resistance